MSTNVTRSEKEFVAGEEQVMTEEEFDTFKADFLKRQEEKRLAWEKKWANHKWNDTGPDYEWELLSDADLYKFFYHFIVAIENKDEKAQAYYGEKFKELFGEMGTGYGENTRAYAQFLKAHKDYLQQSHR